MTKLLEEPDMPVNEGKSFMFIEIISCRKYKPMKIKK